MGNRSIDRLIPARFYELYVGGMAMGSHGNGQRHGGVGVCLGNRRRDVRFRGVHDTNAG